MKNNYTSIFQERFDKIKEKFKDEGFNGEAIENVYDYFKRTSSGEAFVLRIGTFEFEHKFKPEDTQHMPFGVKKNDLRDLKTYDEIDVLSSLMIAIFEHLKES